MDSYSDSEFAESECELGNSDCEYSDNYEENDFEEYSEEEISSHTNEDDSTGVPQFESNFNETAHHQNMQWDGGRNVYANYGYSSEDNDSDSDDYTTFNGVVQHQPHKKNVNVFYTHQLQGHLQ